MSLTNHQHVNPPARLFLSFLTFILCGCTSISLLTSGSTDVLLANRIAWVNQHVRYASDTVVYGVHDYWALPQETLSHGQGDCEDVAILYYVLLGQFLKKEDIFLADVYMRRDGKDESHVIALYYDNDTNPVVLDTMTRSIERADVRRDLRLDFLFNDQGVYDAKSWLRSDFRNLGGIQSFPQWHHVLKRMAMHPFVIS